MKKFLLFGLLLAGFGLMGCEFNQLGEDEQVDEFLLVPKQQTTGEKAKTASNQQTSPYSCLISTLADDEADYNYWNQAFWVHFPKPAIEQAEGKTIFKAFTFASEYAGEKAGSWGGKEKIVRVAQCMIPDSELAEKLLEEQLRKFGANTWLENQNSKVNTLKENESLAKSTSDWEWECSQYFITTVCQVDPNTGGLINCVISSIRCIDYELVYNGPIGGGGGGGGFPGDDPGECDPMGTEPCYDDGGGGSIPPLEPDPCSESNPPLYCQCEDTGNSVLDNQALQMVFEDLWNKQLNSNKEQGGFLYENDLTDEWQFFELTDNWAEKRTLTELWFYVPPNLPEGSIYIHTHPTQSSLTEHGITFEYEHVPSQDDRDAMAHMSSNHSVAYGVIIDPVYRILVGPDGNVITKETRCGY